MFHPGTSSSVDRNLPLHRGINFSSMDVGGDLGGFVFAVGSVVAVLIGLPWLIPAYVASVALGVLLAVALHAWHVRR
jgi:hypothetical protein